MRIYFVRHGETESNFKGYHQTKDSSLTERGHEQAKFLAKRFLEVPIDRILCSPYIRAVETARYITDGLHKEIEFVDELIEIKRPSETEGKNRNDPQIVAIRALIRERFADPNWHYSDEENFEDLKLRARKFLGNVELSGLENILVVTHGEFMVFLVLYMKFRESLTPELYLSMQTFLHHNNTGITLLDNSWDGNWWLISWNDHGHLGYFYK